MEDFYDMPNAIYHQYARSAMKRQLEDWGFKIEEGENKRDHFLDNSTGYVIATLMEFQETFPAMLLGVGKQLDSQRAAEVPSAWIAKAAEVSQIKALIYSEHIVPLSASQAYMAVAEGDDPKWAVIQTAINEHLRDVGLNAIRQGLLKDKTLPFTGENVRGGNIAY